MKIFRWKAVVPMVLTVVLVAVLWTLYIDRVIRRAIEFAASDVVGAKVELASAHLRLRHADLVLTGLQVTDPDAPMTNLMEVPEIRASLNGRALFMKKVVVESLALRGVRFGTPRKESGALKNPSPASGEATRRVLGWINSIPIPTLDLRGLVGTVVRIPAVNIDSLRTPRQARLVVVQGDSLRGAWEAELRGLDPRPTVDSARALAGRLQAANIRGMNAVQLAATASEVRTMIGRVGSMKARVDTAALHANAGVNLARAGVAGLEDARRADLAFVRGLVRIPSFAAPDVSMSMFGPLVTERLKPVMYWVNVAENYVPPGLDPRRHAGPARLRRPGTTFDFPLAHTWPSFLVEHAVADLAIGGRTAAAGAYVAEFAGVTTEPAVYGRATTFRARRTSSVGPRDLRVSGAMDRTGRIAFDSLQANVPRLAVPSFNIPGAGARLEFGDSSFMQLGLARAGTELRGTWRMTADAVHWRRTSDSSGHPQGVPPQIGSQAWAESLIWRAIADIPRVEIEASLTGPLRSPHLSVSSNIGDALAASVKRVMGAELQRAEAQVRAKVDSLVAKEVAAARAKVAALEAEARERIAAPREQLAQVEAELKEALSRVTSVVPGVRLPGLPTIPRPGRP